MVIAPLVDHKAYEDHCEHCGCTRDFWLERGVIDFTTKKVTFYFYCVHCREHDSTNHWKRIVVADLPI